jgi:uncharacterized protein YdbL (DUF1318 family)
MHTWDRSDGSGKAKSSLGRIVSIATLVISLAALYLAMKKPAPVAPSLSASAVAANAQSFQSKVSQLEQAQSQGQTGSEVHLNAAEISAAISQATTQASAAASQLQPISSSSGTSVSDPTAAIAPGAIDASAIGEPMVTIEGDLIRGQFLTEIGGKKVYVTVAGHLGAKDGYATFEPTEFKVGDLAIPVSLVKDALQKKMLEQRDRLKLPDFVSDVKVENGELVMKQK